jgi:HEPN domain-containing protein
VGSYAQYFFSDIKKEGIVLYDSSKYTLAVPKELSYQERYRLAKEDFDYWFNNAKEFLIDFQNAFERKSYNKAAFELHQTTERLYSGILLVFTRYKPNTHNLEELRSYVNALDQRFIHVFPLATAEEARLFTLLCKAYVDARYNKSYAITAEELTGLADQVQELTQLMETLCQEKIQSFLEQSQHESVLKNSSSKTEN